MANLQEFAHVTVKNFILTSRAMQSFWRGIILSYTFFILTTCGSRPAVIQVNLNVTEETEVPFCIGTLDGLLPPGSRIVDISSSDSFKQYVSINRKSRKISQSKLVDREKACPGQMQCLMESDIYVQNGTLLTLLQLKIEVLDINDNSPLFPEDAPDEFSLSEAAAIGTILTLPSATDCDSPIYGVTWYNISDDNYENDTLPFTLSTHEDITGGIVPKLILTRPLDREKCDLYLINITARDGGYPRRYASKVIKLYILDINDNPPVFANKTYHVYIDEDAAVGTKLEQMKAADADSKENSMITYHVTVKSALLYGDTFQLDDITGELSLIRPLDREKQDKYVLNIRAVDSGIVSLSSFAVVVIYIKDMNDNKPVINLTRPTVPPEVEENMPYGTPVTMLTIRDRDAGINGQVLCVINDTDFELIHLFKERYQVVTSHELDAEKSDVSDVTVSCLDGGRPRMESSLTFKISVNDVNDNVPEFTQKSFAMTIAENNQPGIELIRVAAQDTDSGMNGIVRYALNVDTPNGFTIDALSGSMVSNVILDREECAFYSVEVIAHDMGNPQLTSSVVVNITISDLDDNPPIFVKRAYTFSIQENVPSGTEVGHVVANDIDLPPNNRFAYYFTKVSGLFRIDAVSGLITTIGLLDREEKATHRQEVRVTSLTDDTFTDVVPVNIYITDLNDNSPIFVFPVTNVNTILLDKKVTVGSVISQVSARDADEGKNGLIRYSLPGKADLEYVQVEKLTGIITLKRLPPEGSVSKLYVKATDNGIPSLSTVAELYLKRQSTNTAVVTRIFKDFSHSTGSSNDGFPKDNMALLLSVACVSLTLILILVAIVVFLRCQQMRSDARSRVPNEPRDLIAQTFPHAKNMLNTTFASTGSDSAVHDVSAGSDEIWLPELRGSGEDLNVHRKQSCKVFRYQRNVRKHDHRSSVRESDV